MITKDEIIMIAYLRRCHQITGPAATHVISEHVAKVRVTHGREAAEFVRDYLVTEMSR